MISPTQDCLLDLFKKGVKMKFRVFLFLVLFFSSFVIWVIGAYAQLNMEGSGCITIKECLAWNDDKVHVETNYNGNTPTPGCALPSSSSCPATSVCNPDTLFCEVCIAPKIPDDTTNTCVTPPPPKCIAPKILDAATNTCVTPPTCPSPSFTKAKSVGAETGNQYQEVDYLSGGLSPLKLSRYYNSADTNVSNFGMGWRSSYSRSLNLSANVVEVIRDDGKSLTFTLVAGVWLSEKDVKAQLLQTATGWSYFPSANELETYNSNGQLTSMTDHSGLATTFHYDAEGHLVTVVNPLGRSLSFAYTDSLVNFVTVADGTVYQYVYDANRLVKVIYPDQRFHRYLYENKQNPQILTGIEDGKGKRFAAQRAKAIPIPLPFPIKVIVSYGVCLAVNCDQLLANTVQTLTDAVSKVIEQCHNKVDCQDSSNKADCSKAIKLLEQVERLAQKYGKKLSKQRLEELRQKIQNGSISSNDLPGFMQAEFPARFQGMSLSQIREICSKSKCR